MGEISGLTMRPTTALPAHIKVGTVSKKTAAGVMCWVMP
jgi:hypothetical protein